MRAGQTSALTAFVALLASQYASAQTSTKCNPLHQSCPADPALGGTKNIDFTSGADPTDFSSSGPITYDSTNGATFTIAKSGDSPTITSNWYLMFGKVDIEMKAAPGTGIVSSLVMQSDDLDEIDWEILGSQGTQVQTNYFGKGQTGSYDRGSSSSDPTGTTGFNTYTIDWSSTQIVWQLNGQTVRTLSPDNAKGQYPQTPLQLKLGSWAGGDASLNQPGVVAWAGGNTDYSQGPFKMYIKSIKAQDYSTGKSYTYSGTDGTWQQVKSDGGSVNGGSSQVSSSVSSSADTTTTSGQPVPFAGTHASSSTDGDYGAAHPIMPMSSATATPIAASSGSSPASASAGSSAAGSAQAQATAGSAASSGAQATAAIQPSAPFRAGDAYSPSSGGQAAVASPSFATMTASNATPTPAKTSSAPPAPYTGAAGHLDTKVAASFAGMLGLIALAL